MIRCQRIRRPAYVRWTGGPAHRSRLPKKSKEVEPLRSVGSSSSSSSREETAETAAEQQQQYYNGGEGGGYGGGFPPCGGFPPASSFFSRGLHLGGGFLRLPGGWFPAGVASSGCRWLSGVDFSPGSPQAATIIPVAPRVIIPVASFPLAAGPGSPQAAEVARIGPISTGGGYR